jgi:AcrR family transcriptional regulator
MEKDAQTRLIEASTPLFAKKGFAAASVRQLAEASGVNVAAISYYFKGKEGLYQAVLEEQFLPIRQILRQAEQLKSRPAVERLTLYAKSIVNVHRQRPYLIRFFHSELTNPTPCFETVVKKHISQAFAYLSATLADGVRSGDFKPDLNTIHATLSLAGILNFYYIAKPLFGEFTELTSQTDVEYTTQAFNIFLAGIRR